MATFAAFSDPMLTSVQDTTLWGGNFGTLSWTGGGFTITNPIAYTGYGGQDSLTTYDLTSSECYCLLANAGNQALTSCETVPIKLLKDTNNTVFWYINTGNLLAIKKIAGVQTTVATTVYSSAVHVWFRIRESAGTIFWDYSTNGYAWTTLTSLANPFAVTAMTVEPSMGTFNPEVSATTAKWTSFDVPPVTLSTYTPYTPPFLT
jgi:hypothetical protein